MTHKTFIVTKPVFKETKVSFSVFLYVFVCVGVCGGGVCVCKITQLKDQFLKKNAKKHTNKTKKRKQPFFTRL